MKKTVLALIVTLSAYAFCMAQEESQNDALKMEKLAETSTSWDGTALPNYPTGQPVVTVMRYTFPPNMRLDEHYHPIINCGVILSGEMTIVSKTGAERTFYEGDAIVEMINSLHYGENRGNVPTEIIMFYAGEANAPLSIKP